MPVAPCLRNEKTVLKDEYKKFAEEINKKNELIRAKYTILVNDLEDLGFDCDNLKGPTLQSVPDDWYISNTRVDTNKSGISVMCHSGTKFYKYLQEHGIFEKYFPEWYKKGSF